MLQKGRLFLVITLFVVSTSGCALLVAGAVGGTGTAVWLSDKLSQEVNASYVRSIEAVDVALKSLKLSVAKKTVKNDVAQIISTYSDGKRIWIDVRPISSTSSRIDVRVGALGDEIASRRIMDAILQYL